MFSQMATIEQLVARISQQKNLTKAMHFAKQNFNIAKVDIQKIIPQQILQHFAREDPSIQNRHDLQIILESSTPEILEQIWHSNEFKIFVWISVCLSFVLNKSFEYFNSTDLSFLQRLFIRKNPLFLQYQLLSLQKQGRRKNDDWEQEEVTLLISIIKLIIKLFREKKFAGKWSDISFALFSQSDKKYFRNSHKCREKWFNYLNPVVNHDKWTLEEDCELFKIAGKLGTKWAKISKAMDGVRTEHMVKNRFNSIVKQYRSRFQRYSKHRMIQNIEKDLNNKLINSIDKPSQFIQEQCLEKYQMKKIISDHPTLQQDSKFSQNKYTENIHKEYDCEQYCNALNQQGDVQNLVCFVDQFGALMDYNVIYGNRNVELVDYLSVDYEVKKTIFSGNE